VNGKCFEKVRTIQQNFFSKEALRLAVLKGLLIFLLLEEIKKEKWDGTSSTKYIN